MCPFQNWLSAVFLRSIELPPCSLARAFLFAYGGICAAKNVHKRLFGVVMEAKTSFFDATPIGRILNRFSSDLYTVDDSLPFILNIFLARLFAVVGVLVICVYSVPWIVLLLVPLGFVYHDVQGRSLLGFLCQAVFNMEIAIAFC